jgi:gamma-glutamylcyclotransferase (GGCT)/AIG2-like uncharacterized protein YtfP
MFIDNYEIITLGTKYEGNKEKKNQILTRVYSDDGIILKKLHDLIDTYDDTVNDRHGCKCTVTVKFEQGD